MTDLSGTVCVVTGANSGVGKSATTLLAARGASVHMICRNPRKGEAALAEIQRKAKSSAVFLHIADLSSLAAVRTVARELTELGRIDLLVNNAGVYRARREISEDGFEMTMAVNHLAHFLLTQLLFNRIAKASGQVINVSSEGHRSGDLRGAPLESIVRGEGRYSGMKAYSDSKLANVLFTVELARRHGGDGITTNAVHPGVLSTRIWNQNVDPLSLFIRLFKPFMGRPRRGGKAILRLASDPDLAGVTGKYFRVLLETMPGKMAHDRALASELWDLCASLTGS
jgi:NAD(P)-dependent dehydrogenase (short-subunit alcohol dehydrogenase family)